MMFTLLTLILLTLAAAKQDCQCPICRDFSSVSSSESTAHVRDSCSRAIRSTNNSPCPDGKVCKVFNAGMSTSINSNVGYGYWSMSIKQIGCYHPSDSCMSKFDFGTSMQCTESYFFNPDNCPGCMITQGRISKVDYTAEDQGSRKRGDRRGHRSPTKSGRGAKKGPTRSPRKCLKFRKSFLHPCRFTTYQDSRRARLVDGPTPIF